MFRPNPRDAELEERLEKVDLTNVRSVLQISREIANDDLWKIYGRESEAGKLLFKLFHKGHAPKINYPKPKVKPKSESMTPLPKPKVIPKSKTVIQYPKVRVKGEGKTLPPIYPVDLIPKRKPEHEIKKK
jgi:hypothetical protein